MCLNGTDVFPLLFISESSRSSGKLCKYPLHRCKTTVTLLLVHCSDAFCERHIDFLPSSRIGLFDHFVEHVLQSLVATLNSANLFWTLQSGRIESHSFLGKSVHEHASVVHATISCDKLRPTERSDPAFGQRLQTGARGRYSVSRSFAYNECLLKCRTIVNNIEDIVERSGAVLDFTNINSNLVVEYVRLWSTDFVRPCWRFCRFTHIASVCFGRVYKRLRRLGCP